MLSKHYATRTRLVLVDRLADVPHGPEVAVLSLAPISNPEDYRSVEVLSETGHLRMAAANLFAALRRLDACGAELIVARRVPDEGLGRAINDRLERAAATFAIEPTRSANRPHDGTD
jgi:L-threonylcarbamoyladenylate synthase